MISIKWNTSRITVLTVLSLLAALSADITKRFLVLVLLMFPLSSYAGAYGGNPRLLFPQETSGPYSDYIATNTGSGVDVSRSGASRVSGLTIPRTATTAFTRAKITTAATTAASALCGGPVAMIACAVAIDYGITKGITACIEYGWCKNPDPVATGEEQTVAQKCARPAVPRTDGGFFNSGEFDFPTLYTARCKMEAIYQGNTSYAWGTPFNITFPPGKEPSSPPWNHPGFPPHLDQKQGEDPSLPPKLVSDSADNGYPPEPSTPGPNVSAPPVTGSPTVTGTSTKQNADGSTSTSTTTTTTTVTPTVNNNQTTNTTITYQTTNNTTTTTTNNTTNQTTTENKTEAPNTDTPPSDPPPMPELPNDYNREVTQQKVLDALNPTGAPDMPDQKALVDAAKSKSDADLTKLTTDAQTGQADHTGWFSWVWTPPAGSCSPSSGSVHGYAVSWDICPTVANIRDVLGWLFALFGAIQIYGQLFKRAD